MDSSLGGGRLTSVRVSVSVRGLIFAVEIGFLFGRGSAEAEEGLWFFEIEAWQRESLRVPRVWGKVQMSRTIAKVTAILIFEYFHLR